MSGSAFFDSNILIYRFSPLDALKQERARELIRQAVAAGNGVISYQVVQEVLNVGLKGATGLLAMREANLLLQSFSQDFKIVAWSLSLVDRALQIKERYEFQWYDSLVLSAALGAKCETLYTEDLQHGQRIEGLVVVNPFR